MEADVRSRLIKYLAFSYAITWVCGWGDAALPAVAIVASAKATASPTAERAA